MKFSMRQLDLEQVDIARQRVVHAPPQRLGGHRRDDVEVRDLFEGMHACIGTPRTVQLELRLSGHLADDTRNLPLNRPRVFLDLPAAVLRAGVLDEEFESGHQNLERGTRNPEPGTGTRNRNLEPEPGTWNLEPGTEI